MLYFAGNSWNCRPDFTFKHLYFNEYYPVNLFFKQNSSEAEDEEVARIIADGLMIRFREPGPDPAHQGH
jgi:hypothetical protein